MSQFTRGFITEATALNFPENAAVDMLNVEIERDGTVKPRLGIDEEDDSVLVNFFAEDFDRRQINQYVWRSVAENGNIEFLVVQTGRVLFFFDLNASGAISSNLLTTINIEDVGLAGPFFSVNTPFSFTSGKGVLFLTGREIDPVAISFNPVTSAFTPTKLTLEVRDFVGIDIPSSAIGRTQRPTSANSQIIPHIYNIRNQGWTRQGINVFRFSTALQGPPRFPSNADVQFLNKDAQGTLNSFLIQRDSNSEFIFGNSQAPKGHYITEYFRDNKSEASAPDNADQSDAINVGAFEEPINIRAKAIAFFNGRVFYAVGSTVLFSQILEGNDIIPFSQKCFQEQDPTAEELNELVATDGGTIKIPEAGDIVSMIPASDGVLVFSTEGVFFITGADSFFSATDVIVNKITTISTDSVKSVLDIEDSAIMLSDQGIILIAPNDIGDFTATNLTEETIHDFYISIRRNSRDDGFLVHDRVARKIFWFYNEFAAPFSILRNRSECNKALVFDQVLQAFYPYDIDRPTGTTNTGATVVGGFIDTELTVGTSTLDIVDGNGVVVTTSAGNVTSSIPDNTNDLKSIKLLSVRGGANPIVDTLTVSEFKDTNFVDWQQQVTDESAGTASDFTAFVESSHFDLEEPSLNKTGVVTHFFFKQTERNFVSDGLGGTEFDLPSGVQITYRPDWSNATDSGLEGPSQQGYILERFDSATGFPSSIGSFSYGQSVVRSKLTFDGSGPSTRYRFEKEFGKDFQLIGWTEEINTTTRPK